MTTDYLKKIRPIPGFDCVKMKHDIQAKIYEETKDMTREERMAYMRRKSDAFRARTTALEKGSPELLLREEPPE